MKKSVNNSSDAPVLNKTEKRTTAYTEKNLKEKPHNTCFKKLELAEAYLEKHPKSNLYLFSEDKSLTGTKQFYTMTHNTVYNLSKLKKFHLYEIHRNDQQLKLHFDIDVKVSKTNIPTANDNDRKNILDAIVFNVVTEVNKKLDKSGMVSKCKCIKPTKSVKLNMMDNLSDDESDNKLDELIDSDDYMDDFVKEENKCKCNDYEIIVLFSSRPNKLSAHIIYNNVVFNNIREMKFFITENFNKMISDKVIDVSIYRPGCFRMLWNSKYGVNVNLEYHAGINYTKTTDKTLFMDSLLRNINKDKARIVPVRMPKNVKIKPIRILSTNAKKNKQFDEMINRVVDIPINILKQYVELYDVQRSDNYLDWILVGIALKNSNPTEESFNLFDEFSKRSGNYDGRDLCLYKWNSFTFGNLGFPSIKMWAKIDNKDDLTKYSAIKYTQEDKILFNSIKITQNYLLDRNDDGSYENLNTSNNIIPASIRKWLSSKALKSLCIRSPYNTGKTRLIKEIMRTFNIRSVLFVVYRQSLSYDLHKEFLEFKVLNYLDGNFSSKSMICQIESLWRLLPKFGFDGVIDIPSYDLIVLDEIESILNHLKSPTMGDMKENKYDLMHSLIHNAKKVLALDGDFGNRAFEFIEDFGKYIIIENKVKKNCKNFVFTNDRDEIEKKIDDDLKAGKNIVIPSMSATIAEYFYNKYNEKYKTILHCSRSDDKLKTMLKNVEEHWTQYNLLIYSPSIEAGVNFDIPHYDNIYCILSNKSCSPRSFMQMISRVRKYNSNTVNIYLNGLPFRENIFTFTFNEVKEHMLNLQNKYCKRVRVKDPETGLMVYKKDYKFGLYEKMMVYNEMEYLNQSESRFVGVLIRLLIDKGHTYQYVPKPDKVKPVYNKAIITKAKLLEAEDITLVEYKELVQKKKTNNASDTEKIQMERYKYIRNWNLTPEKFNSEFLDKWYGKDHVLKNLKILLKKKELKIHLKKYNDESVLNLDAIKQKDQYNMIRQLLHQQGFTCIEKCLNEKTRIERETFDANVELVKTNCDIFTDSQKAKKLFGVDKITDTSFKDYTGTLNAILKQWGIAMKNFRSSRKIKVNGETKHTDKKYYRLVYIDNIDKYL